MHFIRLIRPVNLLVIILTMYGIRVFFIPYLSEDVLLKRSHPNEVLDYFLLVFSTVLIAAAFCMFNRYVDGLAANTPTDLSTYPPRAKQVAENGYGSHIYTAPQPAM